MVYIQYIYVNMYVSGCIFIRNHYVVFSATYSIYNVTIISQISHVFIIINFRTKICMMTVLRLWNLSLLAIGYSPKSSGAVVDRRRAGLRGDQDHCSYTILILIIKPAIIHTEPSVGSLALLLRRSGLSPQTHILIT